MSSKFREALAHLQRGDLARAEALCFEFIQESSEPFPAMSLLGVISIRRGDLHKADRLFEQALAVNPAHAETLSNHGTVLLGLNRPADALASYDKALAKDPRFVVALSGRGNALAHQGRLDDAVVSFRRALEIKPDYPEALSNLGTALMNLMRLEESLSCFDKALEMRPRYPVVLFNRGNVLAQLRRHDEALLSYETALAIEPGYADVDWNEAICRLWKGDFKRGWEKHESRWQTVLRAERRNFPQPLWLGEDDVRGKTVLLHCEQGFGDSIQFCRYAALVSARGARVVLEVPPALKSLFETLGGVHQVVVTGEPLPHFDVHCPLMSLPLAFKTDATNIPASVPYLETSAALVTAWSENLSAKLPQKSDRRPRIGLAWSGNPKHINDGERSIALSRLAPLLTSGASLVSLQRELRTGDGAWLGEHSIPHFGDQLRDFADTAALISLMDLVISVDTSIAHLAGALGKPVWILLPFIKSDWRWLLDRDDSPWYPTARLFRQRTVNDWDGVVTNVASELRQRFGGL